MFRKELKRKLSEIFAMSVSFQKPSDDTPEQEIIFVEIDDSQSKVTHGKQVAKVNGSLVMYAPQEKLPFGFFTKKINQAGAELNQGFFFYGMDENKKTYVDLVERRCRFVFLYSGDYDPEAGTMTSVEFE